MYSSPFLALALLTGTLASFAAERPPLPTPEQKQELADLVATATACRSAEDVPKLEQAWNQYKERAEQIRMPGSETAYLWIEPIAVLGSDALWKEYTDWVRNRYPGQSVILYMAPIARPSLKARLAPLLRDEIATMKSPSASILTLMARVARSLDDDEGVRLLLEHSQRLPKVSGTGINAMWQQLRLRMGEPEAVQPVVWARPDPSGHWHIQWTLCGITDRYEFIHCLDIGGSTLDGAFDVIIQAAPDEEQFTDLQRLPAADSRGSVLLPIPQDTRYIAVSAVNRTTGTSHRSKLLPLFFAASTPDDAIRIPEPYAIKREDRTIPRVPFGKDEALLGVDLSSGETVEIATLPWHPGYSTELSLWMCFENGAHISATILDPQGNTVSNQRFRSDPADVYLPVWTFQSLALHSQNLANADRIVLTATAETRHTLNVPNLLWLWDLRRQEYEPNSAPPGTEIVAAAPAGITAMDSDATGRFLAMALKGGRLALMDTNDGTVRQSKPAPDRAYPFVGAAPQSLIAVDYAHGVHVMDRSSLAVKSIGTLDATLLPKYDAVFQISPDGQWLFWLGRDSDVFAIKVSGEALGNAVRIPVGHSPELMIDRTTATLHVSGTVHTFAIPLRTLPDLDPATLTPVQEPGATTAVAHYLGRGLSYWVDPVHGIYLANHGSSTQFDPKNRFLSATGYDSVITVTPAGLIYFGNSSGMVRRLDPATVEGYLPPETPGAPLPGHNRILMGDDEVDH